VKLKTSLSLTLYDSVRHFVQQIYVLFSAFTAY